MNNINANIDLANRLERQITERINTGVKKVNPSIANYGKDTVIKVVRVESAKTGEFVCYVLPWLIEMKFYILDEGYNPLDRQELMDDVIANVWDLLRKHNRGE